MTVTVTVTRAVTDDALCSSASWDQQDFSDLEGIPELAGQGATRAGSLDLSSAGLAQAAAFDSSPQGRPTPLLASWRVARPARPFTLSTISGSSGSHALVCRRACLGCPTVECAGSAEHDGSPCSSMHVQGKGRRLSSLAAVCYRVWSEAVLGFWFVLVQILYLSCAGYLPLAAHLPKRQLLTD